MRNATSKCRSMLLFVLLSLSVPAIASSPLSIAPLGNGSFILQGNGLVNVAVIDLLIQYDSSALANPRISQGSLTSGAMTSANVSVPGNVGLWLSAFGNAIKGSGPVATITFDPFGDSTGRITSLKGTITDGGGNTTPIALNLGNNNAPLNLGDNNDAPQVPRVADQAAAPVADVTPPPQPVAGQGAAGPPVVGGSVTLPTDQMASRDERKEPVLQPEQVADVAEKKAAGPAPSESRGVEASVPKIEMPAPKPLQSVLEKFRLFKGERTARSLAALFAQPGDARVRQEPAVLIADGKGSVKVTILKEAGEKAPNFAFNSARAVSLTVAEGGFLVEARPDKDAFKAGIVMLVNGTIEELPLTVSPAADVDLDRSGKVTEADFLLFLKQSGTADAAKLDLNRDGKCDYLDDYIFTANYLASFEKAANQKTARQDRAEKR